MKVAISVLGRFHGFDLAREIQSHDCLQQLISSYPSFIAKRFGIKYGNYHSLLHWEVLARSLRKAKPLYKNFWNEQHFISAGFDRAVANILNMPMDIFTGWSGSSLFSLRKARTLGAKIILERGSSHMLHQQEILKEEYARWGLVFNETHPKIIERELQEYKEADFISIPSTFVRRTFVERGIPDSKLIQIPYGVSLNNFLPKLTIVQEAKKPFRIIHAGALSLRKGISYLLQAFNELNLSNSELWLVGSVEDEMKPVLKKYFASNIRIFGKVPQNQLRDYYQAASIFCICSVEDGFGMVVSQAMACGLPVICSVNTGAADIIQNGINGFVLPIRDVERLKEKILFLYERPEKTREMGRNASQHVQSLFTWKDYGNKMISEYEKILSR